MCQNKLVVLLSYNLKDCKLSFMTFTRDAKISTLPHITKLRVQILINIEFLNFPVQLLLSNLKAVDFHFLSLASFHLSSHIHCISFF